MVGLKPTSAGLALGALVALGLGGCASLWVQPSRLAAADGRSYYLFEANYKCTGFGPDATSQPSWRRRIEVRTGALVDWGDRCNNQGVPLRQPQYRFTADLRGLELDGKLYVVSDHPEKELEGAK